MVERNSLLTSRRCQSLPRVRIPPSPPTISQNPKMIIHSLEKLTKIIKQEKDQGKKVLIKKGVFDIIHPGHIYSVQEFKKAADIVIILIQSDSFTTKKKGPTRPINNQEHRAKVIDGIKGVDYVFLDTSNSREEYITLLNKIQPSILAITKTDSKKKQNYTSKYWELKEFPDKNLTGFSTTEIINKVLEKHLQNCRNK